MTLSQLVRSLARRALFGLVVLILAWGATHVVMLTLSHIVPKGAADGMGKLNGQVKVAMNNLHPFVLVYRWWHGLDEECAPVAKDATLPDFLAKLGPNIGALPGISAETCYEAETAHIKRQANPNSFKSKDPFILSRARSVDLFWRQRQIAGFYIVIHDLASGRDLISGDKEEENETNRINPVIYLPHIILSGILAAILLLGWCANSFVFWHRVANSDLGLNICWHVYYSATDFRCNGPFAGLDDLR